MFLNTIPKCVFSYFLFGNEYLQGNSTIISFAWQIASGEEQEVLDFSPQERYTHHNTYRRDLWQMSTTSQPIVQRLWNYCNLLRDESLEGADALPSPDILAASIVEDLQAALEQFAAITEDLGNGTVTNTK